MESSIGVVSYGVAAGAYLLLFAIMATAWRGRFRGGLLLAAVGVMTLWAGINAWQLGERSLPAALIWTLEALHLVFWLEFLWQLLPAGLRA
ncbi:MAG: hypothetical protein JXR29_02985 [Methylothermaceae bacterium]|nr:hypothetical protein [Methylothermaceae bacterium]